MSRGTQATISYANLKHNFHTLNKLAPNKLVLVVKADAYGHGLKCIVQALDDVVDCFGVATIDEALIVRKINSKVRIVLLEGFLNADELKIVFENNIDCVIHQQQQLKILDQCQIDGEINIWLKFDSGMNRLGFSESEFKMALVKLEAQQQVNEIILMSHLASADIKNSNFTQQQTTKFLSLVKENCPNKSISLANTSALLNKLNVPGEWCRVGVALFGVSPIKGTTASDFNLKPVMTLKTNIIALKTVKAGETIGYSQKYTTKKEMQTAVIGIGYADGFPWAISEDAYVKINNQNAKIIGRVSMDMLSIDVSLLKNINVGDSVLIWGEGQNSHLAVETLAQKANTIPYVLLCQITSRVHFNYV